MFELSRINSIAAAEEATIMAQAKRTETSHEIRSVKRQLSSSKKTSENLSTDIRQADYAIEAFEQAKAQNVLDSASADAQQPDLEAAKNDLVETDTTTSEEGVLLRSEKLELLNGRLEIIEIFLAEVSAKKATLAA